MSYDKGCLTAHVVFTLQGGAPLYVTDMRLALSDAPDSCVTLLEANYGSAVFADLKRTDPPWPSSPTDFPENKVWWRVVSTQLVDEERIDQLYPEYRRLYEAWQTMKCARVLNRRKS